jgi:hypothetical protein
MSSDYMVLQTFKVCNTDFKFAIITKNVLQGTRLYVRLTENNTSQLLTSDAARHLFNAYHGMEDLFSRLCYTHAVSYLVVRDDETPVYIQIIKQYNKNNAPIGVKWTLRIIHEPTNTTTQYHIDRKSLWRINLYCKVLDNSLFYWWWRVNEAYTRHTRLFLHCLWTLKDSCKITLLKNAKKGKFISKEILAVFPSAIQKYLQGWSGKYEIQYGHDLNVKEPYDSGHDNDFA